MSRRTVQRNKELYEKYLELRERLGNAHQAMEALTVLTKLSFDTVRKVISHRELRE